MTVDVGHLSFVTQPLVSHYCGHFGDLGSVSLESRYYLCHCRINRMKNRKISPSSNDGRAPRQKGSGAKISSETKNTPKIKKLFKIGVVTFSQAEFVFLVVQKAGLRFVIEIK